MLYFPNYFLIKKKFRNYSINNADLWILFIRLFMMNKNNIIVNKNNNIVITCEGGDSLSKIIQDIDRDYLRGV